MRFGQDVANTSNLKNRTNTSASFHTGTRTCRNHDHLTGAVTANNAMRNREGTTLTSQRHSLDATNTISGIFGGLLNSRRNFVRLAVTNRHPTVLVANNN